MLALIRAAPLASSVTAYFAKEFRGVLGKSWLLYAGLRVRVNQLFTNKYFSVYQ